MPISAQPNPVRIRRAVGIGTTTITWDTGGPVGRVWLSFNGGADTEFDPPKGSPPVRRGSSTSQVSLGDTYEFKLKNSQGAQLDSVIVRTMPAVGEAAADFPDAFIAANRFAATAGLFQQIRTVRVTPGATFADFSFSTTQPAVPIITVATAPPGPGGVFNPSDIVRTASLFFFGPRTQHQTRVVALASGMTYFYTITAASTNPGDPAEVSTGSFGTLMRQAVVHFTVLWVHRDSDTLSNGDLAFIFGVYNGPLGQYLGPTPVLRYPRSGHTSIGDGGSVSLTNEVVVIDNAPDTLTLWVFGEDDDSIELPSFFGGPPFRAALQPPAFAPSAKAHGETDITQWSTALEHIDLPSDLGGSGPRSINFRMESATGGLWYTVLGWVDVSFTSAQISGPMTPALSLPGSAFATDVGLVAAVAADTGCVELVARGPDGAVYHKAVFGDGSGAARHEWENIGTGVDGPITAVSTANGRLDILALTKEGAVYHKCRIGEQWRPSSQGWKTLGGRLKGPITAASTEDGRVELFAAGLDQTCYHRTLIDDSTTSRVMDGWERLDGQVRGTIVAVASESHRIELFAFEPGMLVYHRTWDVRSGQPVQAEWERVGSADTLARLRSSHVEQPEYRLPTQRPEVEIR